MESVVLMIWAFHRQSRISTKEGLDVVFSHDAPPSSAGLHLSVLMRCCVTFVMVFPTRAVAAAVAAEDWGRCGRYVRVDCVFVAPEIFSRREVLLTLIDIAGESYVGAFVVATGLLLHSQYR